MTTSYSKKCQQNYGITSDFDKSRIINFQT